jgi:hypothetical protein
MLYSNIFETIDALVTFVNDNSIVPTNIQAIFERPGKYILLYWA